MVGMARKNENSAAARRSTPSSSAPMMVAPERLTPGTMARHWIAPIFRQTDSGRASEAAYLTRGRLRSTAMMISPPAISATAIGSGANSTSLICLWKATPSTTAGRTAITIPAANSREAGSLGSVTSTRHSLAK